MARPKRSEQTPDLRTAIKTAAWQQIVECGAAALSLRAVARALNITAPAIYNYYPSRDDLVTALIVDAYTDLGDAQYAALESAPAGDHAARLMKLGMAYRQWAVANPQRYQLIFGTPIPGYDAPQETTMPAAARSLAPLIGCIDTACQDHKLRIPSEALMPESFWQKIAVWRQAYQVQENYALYAAIVFWSRVHGLVSLEIGGQFPPFLEDSRAFYQLQMDRIIAEHLIL